MGLRLQVQNCQIPSQVKHILFFFELSPICLCSCIGPLCPMSEALNYLAQAAKLRPFSSFSVTGGIIKSCYVNGNKPAYGICQA